MKTINRIQVEFVDSATLLQIPVRHPSATASRLPDVEMVVSRIDPGNFTKLAGPDRRAADAERFIARIREMLRKQGMR